MKTSRRFDLSKVRSTDNWADLVADTVIAENGEKNEYTVAAGISPSGVVHFGNFRDVITAHMVRSALEKKGKKVRMIFSWDNFDRLRKVPAGVPESFSEHIGKPLSKVPNPFGTGTYAEYFQKPFVEAMKKLSIDIEYKDQTKIYESGIYDEQIKHSLQNREKIAEVLLSFMTEKAMTEKKINKDEYKKNFYPISIYSRFTGKDSTKILSYDGDMTIKYYCAETKQEDTINLSEHRIAKLSWKVDWPMRWKHEGVDFEPGGSDHASPGGSYDVATVLARDIFNIEPPVFCEYMFVGIRGLGSKMSGSKGNAVSPLDLLDIYEPDLLKWLYLRKDPNQSFELAFDSEIYRQYEEYDKEMNINSISFRQLVGLGQIAQWKLDKVETIIKELGVEYDAKNVATRLPLAQNWLVKYNQDEEIKLRESVNTEYVATFDAKRKEQINRLREELLKMENATIADLELLTYHIPKKEGVEETELKKEQRAFFKDIYNLLITKDTGPRLGTFLWAADRDVVLKLLDIG